MARGWIVFCSILLLPGAVAGQAAVPGPGASRAAAETRARALVAQMTLDEKVGQMMNDAPGIPRLGIPAYNWWSEGLHGVARSGYTTLFPQAIGLAATWDADLMNDVGTVVGTEARGKYNDAIAHDNHSIFYGLTIWSPNINILRDPRWGRGQETFGEDPYLTAHMAVPFIRGLQGADAARPLTIATPKHFAVHSGPESDRHKEDVHPSAHDLFDTYLPAFRAAVVEGQAGSLMCAYNAINGTPACANNFLLKNVLRDAWGFRGFVTSDCGAVDDFYKTGGHGYSADAERAAAAAVLAGTDTNCGSTFEALRGALKHGLLQEDDLDRSLVRLFAARYELGILKPERDVFSSFSLQDVDNSAHAATALRAARESMVLLANRQHALPLSADTKRILVVGPSAVSLSSLEGNYNAIPSAPVFPLDGIRTAFPRADVSYAQGSTYADGVTVPVARTMLHTPDGESGLHAEYFAGTSFSGAPIATRTDAQLDFDWTAASPINGISAESFSVRWTGTLQLPHAGAYRFSVGYPECYPCNDREQFRVSIDGKLVGVSQESEALVERPTESKEFIISVSDDQPHTLRVEYSHASPHFGGGFRLDWVPPADALLEEALQKAKDADVVVALVGLSPRLEGEEMPVKVAGFSGGDKTDLALPAEQQRLLEKLKDTGKPLVVVLMNGSALAVGWAKEHADALIEAWYPGQAGGTAIAETLSGANNPSGRLPMTFYKSIADLPAFGDYAMAGRTYRYYRGEPLFGFGFGLSYTHFAYSDVKLPAMLKAGEMLHLSTTVTNDGPRDGAEVVELYVQPPASALAPQRFLAATERIFLSAGEHRIVTLSVDPRRLSLVDKDGNRAVEPGLYRVYVGGSQPAATDAGAPVKITGRFSVPR